MHGPQKNGARLGIGGNLKENRAVGFAWGIDEDFQWANCRERDARLLNGKPERVQ
jgi:hypothetical protein